MNPYHFIPSAVLTAVASVAFLLTAFYLGYRFLWWLLSLRGKR